DGQSKEGSSKDGPSLLCVCQRTGSVHGVERVLANRYARAVVRPERRDRGGGEMIRVRHQHAALPWRKLPVVDRVAGNIPGLDECIKIVEFERAGCGGRGELVRCRHHLAHGVAVMTAVATAQGHLGHGKLAKRRLTACFQVDGGGKTGLVGHGLRHQCRQRQQQRKFHFCLQRAVRAKRITASCAVAVDGRAGRSTWICRHDRNLWPGRCATGLWRFERLCEAGRKGCAGNGAVMRASRCFRRLCLEGWQGLFSSGIAAAGSRRYGFIRFVASIDTPCTGCRDIRSAEPSGGKRRWQVPRWADLTCTHVSLTSAIAKKSPRVRTSCSCGP